jgi:hypothetical protein
MAVVVPPKQFVASKRPECGGGCAIALPASAVAATTAGICLGMDRCSLVPNIRHAAGLVQPWPYSGTHTQVEQRIFVSCRAERRMRLGATEEESRRALAGAGWCVPALLDLLRTARDVYFDEGAQVVVPRWGDGRRMVLSYCRATPPPPSR